MRFQRTPVLASAFLALALATLTAACAPGASSVEGCAIDPTAAGCSGGNSTQSQNSQPASDAGTSAGSAGTGTASTGSGSTGTTSTGSGSTGSGSTSTTSTGSGSTGSGSTGTTSTGSGSTGTTSTGSGSTGTTSTGSGSTGTTSTGSGSTGTTSTGSGSTGTTSTGSGSTGTTSTGSGSTGTTSTGSGSTGTTSTGSGSTGTTSTGSAAPTTYTAYTGTDYKAIPAAPALGAANTVINDPTFGSRILRVTDVNSHNGQSLIPTDAGFHRTFNANNSAIKLTGPDGSGYWLEFNPAAFTVGDGSAKPAVHTVPFGATWEWSAVNPDIIYFLHGAKIASYNKATGVTTDLAGPSNGDAVAYDAVVIGADKWVCSVAGAGQQDTFTKFFCVQPNNPSVSKLVDVANATVNGVAQSLTGWATAAAGQTIGIHDISSGTGSSWLELTFHQQSWGGDGGAVFNIDAGTFSLVTNGDYYWSGHVFMGNGKYANASGSKSGVDSRGMVLRNPDALMDASQYQFVSQPPTPSNDWCDADHSSWFNSSTNPGAPILQSRYNTVDPSKCQFAWTGEIIASATDGSNTVYRFAHNHNSGQTCYYGQSFAQISNDGKWAIFSSPWEGTLGAGTSGGNFDCSSRVDTFIVELK